MKPSCKLEFVYDVKMS